jgi:hypothetical protein
VADKTRNNPSRKEQEPRQRSAADMAARAEASDWFGIGLDEEDAKRKIAKWKAEGLL